MIAVKKILYIIGLLILVISCTKDYAARYSPTSPYIINISIDKDFTLEEQIKINNAFLAWEFASGGQIKFIPSWNKNKPGPFYKNIEFGYTVFIWAFGKEWDLNNFTQAQWAEYSTYNGLFIPIDNDNSVAHILIFMRSKYERADDPANFYRVVLHELGHLLRIKHIPEYVASNTVMHEHARSDCITVYDANALCKLWSCSGTPQC